MKVIMNFDNIRFDGESINQKIDREFNDHTPSEYGIVSYCGFDRSSWESRMMFQELRKAEKREKKENGKRH